MRFLARKRGIIDPARLHEHESVRDLVSRLLAAMESVPGAAGAAGDVADKPARAAFLFASLRSGQGTSTVAAAVARGLAETGRRTLLAVVAEPAVAQSSEAVPLGEVLAAPRPGQAPLLTVQVPPRLSEIPDSARDPRSWADGYPIVVIDAPPLTDGLTRYWVPKAQGIVLVVDGEKVAVRAVVQAREDLQRIGGRLLGVVLNRYRSRIPRWLAPYFVYG
jgi:Mrp family chromosome partitioning ATPase